MSQAPNTELPANLMFRLRALFGVNARAAILAYSRGWRKVIRAPW